MAKTKLFWKTYFGEWFLWGLWLRERWFIGVSRKF